MKGTLSDFTKEELETFLKVYNALSSESANHIISHKVIDAAIDKKAIEDEQASTHCNLIMNAFRNKEKGLVAFTESVIFSKGIDSINLDDL